MLKTWKRCRSHVLEQVNGMGSYARVGAGIDGATQMGTQEEGGASAGRWLPLSPAFPFSEIEAKALPCSME